MVLSLHIISRCNYGLCNCSAKVHSPRIPATRIQFAKLDAQITPISLNGENNNNCRASLDSQVCQVSYLFFLYRWIFILADHSSLFDPPRTRIFSTFLMITEQLLSAELIWVRMPSSFLVFFPCFFLCRKIQ